MGQPTRIVVASSVHPAEQIQRLHANIREVRSMWLERTGWQRSVNTPGGRSMWIKKWRGKILLATLATAAALQAQMDEEERAK